MTRRTSHAGRRALAASALVLLAIASVAVASCGGPTESRSDDTPDGAASGDASSPDAPTHPDAGTDAGGSDASEVEDALPTVCSGQEPCGLYPVVVPAGYKTMDQLTVFNQNTNTSCTSFSDCDQWNAHFTQNWTNEFGVPYDPYYNRMGSPFPAFARYIVVVSPKKVMYAKLRLVSRGDLYRYADGTPMKSIDRQTGEPTCAQRSSSHIKSAFLTNMDGTGNLGKVRWNISVLPGDMGDNGPVAGQGPVNASTCQGTGAGGSGVYVTDDPAYAATQATMCLLREGQDYYVNFMSEGGTMTTDCAKEECSMGFQLWQVTTSDGSPYVVDVPCP